MDYMDYIHPLGILGERCISPNATGQTKVASYSLCSMLSVFTKLLNVMWRGFCNSITGSRVQNDKD